MLSVLLRNWPLKLLALALAYAVWVAVTGESRIMQDLAVPLVIELPDDLTLAEAPPTTVGVRLRGPENLLGRAHLLRLEFHLDLRDAAPGTHSVQLDARDLTGLASGIEVAFVQPERLILVVDTRRQRLVPVVPAFRGSPPSGYTFYGARVVPDTQRVDGPSGAVDRLERLRTDPIPLDGRTASFHVRVRAVPDSDQVRLVDPSPLEVEVHVDRAAREMVFDVPVVLSGHDDWDASAAPARIQVAVAAPPSLLARLQVSQIRAVADLGRLAPRSEPHEVPLRVDFVDVPAQDLARVTLKRISSPTVRVRLSDRATR